jgi:hypothetical protein
MSYLSVGSWNLVVVRFAIIEHQRNTSSDEFRDREANQTADCSHYENGQTTMDFIGIYKSRLELYQLDHGYSDKPPIPHLLRGDSM